MALPAEGEGERQEARPRMNSYDGDRARRGPASSSDATHERPRRRAGALASVAKGRGPPTAADALDRLVDNLESFTRATVLADR